jgi:hypothetical protein
MRKMIESTGTYIELLPPDKVGGKRHGSQQRR